MKMNKLELTKYLINELEKAVYINSELEYKYELSLWEYEEKEKEEFLNEYESSDKIVKKVREELHTLLGLQDVPYKDYSTFINSANCSSYLVDNYYSDIYLIDINVSKNYYKFHALDEDEQKCEVTFQEDELSRCVVSIKYKNEDENILDILNFDN